MLPAERRCNWQATQAAASYLKVENDKWISMHIFTDGLWKIGD